MYRIPWEYDYINNAADNNTLHHAESPYDRVFQQQLFHKHEIITRQLHRTKRWWWSNNSQTTNRRRHCKEFQQRSCNELRCAGTPAT